MNSNLSNTTNFKSEKNSSTKEYLFLAALLVPFFLTGLYLDGTLFSGVNLIYLGAVITLAILLVIFILRRIEY